MSDLRNLPDAVKLRIAGAFGADILTDRRRGFATRYQGETLEQRATRRIEVRDADADQPVIVGYATVYEAPYDVLGGPPYGWTEIISRGATARSVAAGDDVFFLHDHDGEAMARTKSGTLALESDKVGLYSEARPNMSSNTAQYVVSALKRGDLDAMSFAFRVNKQRWEDENGDETDPATAPIRRIQDVTLYDTSVVKYPANPATVVSLRASGGMTLAEAQAALAALRAS